MPRTSWLTKAAIATGSALGTLALTRRDPPGAPMQGPADLDTAVSDFTNRLARIARYTPRAIEKIPEAWIEIKDAAHSSFGHLNLEGPRKIAFPFQLALSFGSLLAISTRRIAAMFRVMGPRKIRSLMRDFFVMHTEQAVFLGLQYDFVIERCKERLKAAPHDTATRIQLGRLMIKCGLYEEAEQELSQISVKSPRHAAALHEASVALHRAGRFAAAVEAGAAALEANPANQRTRHWLWLTAQKLGGYPSHTPPELRMEVKAGYNHPTVEFEDIAARIGLDKTSAGRGTAIFDYNNDGYLDIVISGAHSGCSLFRNNGDGTFTDVSVGSGIDKCVNSFAVCAGDYNNDGFTDLFITRLGFYCGEAVLFRNNGDGTFTNVTAEAGLSLWGPAFSASWVDYDNDGFLDLYIANNLGGLFERKTPNRLFHNNGDGTFTEVAEQAGLSTIWPTIAGTWGDYNNDGFPDLFVSNGLGGSQLYRNNGNGTFTDVSKQAGVAKFGFGSPAFWWDFDNDGWLDLCQFEWSDHEDFIHTMAHGQGPADGNPMRVYRNNRNGTFTQVGRELGLTECWGTMSGNACDFNNDGNMDLVLGNGGPRMDRLEPMILMQNDGKSFRNITFAAGLPFTGKSHGVNAADLFGDGRISVLVASGGAYPGDLLTTGVYCPKTLPGNYVNIRLTGVTSNRSAIGARVTVAAGGKRQLREISGGSNFGCLPLEQHYGLGGIGTIDAVEIRWPSGLAQRFENVPVNKTWQFIEGRTEYEDVYANATSQLQSA